MDKIIIHVGDLVSVEDPRSRKEKIFRVEQIFIIQDSLNKEEVSDVVYHIAPYPFNHELADNPIIMYKEQFKKVYKEVK